LRSVHRKHSADFSATIDAALFADYFGAPGPITPDLKILAPVILVDGHNYTVKVYFDTSALAVVERFKEHSKVRSELALAAAIRVQKIVRRRKMGDILIFLPGQVAVRYRFVDWLKRRSLKLMLLSVG
jgi:HrpA-like RNA helicase